MSVPEEAHTTRVPAERSHTAKIPLSCGPCINIGGDIGEKKNEGRFVELYHLYAGRTGECPLGQIGRACQASYRDWRARP